MESSKGSRDEGRIQTEPTFPARGRGARQLRLHRDQLQEKVLGDSFHTQPGSVTILEEVTREHASYWINTTYKVVPRSKFSVRQRETGHGSTNAGFSPTCCCA